MEDRAMLQSVDYVIICIMLTIPLSIGLFFAIKDANKTTRDEYLLGGRRMSMLPVTLSIFVSFQSAISLIGVPSEVYQYGSKILLFYIGTGISFLLACVTVTPLMHPLHITSVYEYMERRFDSVFVRLMSTTMGMFQTFCYMVVALLAPGLALEAAAGIPLWLSVVIVGVAGTVYTSAGGFKSVIWTDVVQTILVFTGMLVTIITACYDVGGVKKTLDMAEQGRRINFKELRVDPRVRHTYCGLIIGGMFVWLTNLFGQSNVQRISSLKSVRDGRKAMLLNGPINFCYGILLVATGWCMYAYLFHYRCDPYEAGMVSNSNQMTPFFVLHTMHEFPGMAGLYMSALFSGALSTLSTGINSLAANTVEDLLQKPLRSVSEKTATTITKMVVFFYGTTIMMVVYLVKSLQGPVKQLADTVSGTFGCPVLGVFLMGCCVPWANKYGAVSGCIVSVSLSVWMAVGSRLYGTPAPRLDHAPIDQCFSFNTTESNSTSIGSNSTGSLTQNCSTLYSNDTEGSLGNGFYLYEISYEWYSVISTVVCVVVGLTVSRITRNKAPTRTDPKLIIPISRRFWKLHDDTVVTILETKADQVNDTNTTTTERETCSSSSTTVGVSNLINDKTRTAL